MPPTVPSARSSDPVLDLDSIRGTSVKAGLRSDPIGQAIGAVVADAVVRHYGSVKAAAITLAVDPSQLMREFKAGNVARLDRDPEARAYVADALRATFADDDPKARARRLLRDVRRTLDELAEVI